MKAAQSSPIVVEPALETASEYSPGVTFRVVVLSLLIAVFFAWAIPVIDYRFFNTFLGATHLPPGAVGALLVLMLVVNPLLRLVSKKLSFRRNEVLTVYLTCLFSTLTVGIGGNNYFVSFIIGSFYYATRENKWFDVLKGLPPWFSPALNADGTYNRYVVESWYTGLSQGQSIPWGAWIVPLTAWGAFFAASFGMMACLSVILRAQWGEREVLAFPLLRLPLTLTEDLDSDDKYAVLGHFFRNPLMWTGFAIAVFIQALRGLNLYFPDVPTFPLSIDTGRLFSEAPWNQVGWLPIQIYPIAVGIAYFLSGEVGFSLWFFFLFMKIQLVVAGILGYPASSLPQVMESGGAVFHASQESGAFFAYAAVIFWTGRRHFAHVFQRAIRKAKPTETERNEALSYPVAFWGFVGSFAFMVAWGIAAGMSPALSLLLWTSYLLIAVVLSRVVAEGGLLFVHHNWQPLGTFAGLIGMGPGTLLSASHGISTAAFMEASTIQDYRGSLMPSFVQSFKLAHDQKIHGKKLFALLTAVIIVGMIVGFSMNVRLGYENSGLGLQGWLRESGPRNAGDNAYSMTQQVASPDITAWIWTFFAIAIVWATMAMRARFAWFPLHPLGYVMAVSYPAHAFWFSIFVGWGAKSLITKYSGADATRKVGPLFLGLALGDVAMMLFWICVDGWFGRTGHQLMPG
ncbi:hypothetical protein IAD21_01570 [Abditibacteriota bacterium]|nr:hypothetical protein IAD21_01570 [Abditibacteriota bacterium]